MTRNEAMVAIERGREHLTAAGWAPSGEHRGGGYWFVCGRRGDRMDITLEYDNRWDATIRIGAHEVAHQWCEATGDVPELIAKTTSAARDVLTAQVEALR